MIKNDLTNYYDTIYRYTIIVVYYETCDFRIPYFFVLVFFLIFLSL
jgi:hypothetical protein